MFIKKIAVFQFWDILGDTLFQEFSLNPFLNLFVGENSSRILNVLSSIDNEKKSLKPLSVFTKDSPFLKFSVGKKINTLYGIKKLGTFKLVHDFDNLPIACKLIKEPKDRNDLKKDVKKLVLKYLQKFFTYKERCSNEIVFLVQDILHFCVEHKDCLKILLLEDISDKMFYFLKNVAKEFKVQIVMTSTFEGLKCFKEKIIYCETCK